jgi:hypothetical protein
MTSLRRAGALVLLVLLPQAAAAQSGRGALNGWVAFDGIAYVEKQPDTTAQKVPH